MAEEVRVRIPGPIWKAPVKPGDAAAAHTCQTGGAVAQVAIERSQDGFAAGVVAVIIESEEGTPS